MGSAISIGLPHRLVLDRGHVSQHWFNDRDIKLMARWEQQGDRARVREVILIVEARRRAKRRRATIEAVTRC